MDIFNEELNYLLGMSAYSAGSNLKISKIRRYSQVGPNQKVYLSINHKSTQITADGWEFCRKRKIPEVRRFSYLYILYLNLSLNIAGRLTMEQNFKPSTLIWRTLS